MSLLVEAAEIVRICDRETPTPETFSELMLAEPSAEEVLIDGVHYRPHANGGGLVAITAFVGNDVYVEKRARVEGNAVVLGSVRISGRAIVRGNATVTERCSLSGDSIVEGFATLIGMVTLRRHARVGGTARLEGDIVLDCHTRITRGQLFGPLFIG